MRKPKGGKDMKTAIVLMALVSLPLSPQTSRAETPSASSASNPEMKRIYDADQAERTGKINHQTLGPNDATRRQQTRDLLAAGQLHTGDDFLEAAFVFQHGQDDDFLLAHTLAVIATKKGASGGPWIAAATLDRYLQSHGHKQIYGTQVSSHDGVVSKEPFDRDLISDALRGELGVPDLAAQDQKFEKMKGQMTQALTAATQPGAGTSIRCDSGPIDRVFVRATWKLRSCDNGILLAFGTNPDVPTLVVSTAGGRVTVTRQGSGDDAETKVATAAFQAMTPDQVADIVAQTKQH
jgi:hypothetical protein